MAAREAAVATARPAPSGRNPLHEYLPAPAAPEPELPSMTMGEVATGAWENLGPSAKQFAQDIARVVTHPVETAEGLGKAIIGAGQKLKDELGIEPTGWFGDQRESAEEVGKFFSERYGGEEELKRTIATDPVGFAADAATVLTGGGGALARAPATAGRLGRVAATTGRAIDPTTLAVAAGKATGRAVGTAASAIPGMTTGAGTKAVRTAVTSGVAGGDLGQKFREAMRGNVPMEEVVNDARSALSNMYQARSQKYRTDMAAVNKDPTILDFSRVDKALKDISGVKKFRGVPISRSTESVRGRISEIVDQWRDLEPSQYHTVEGFDAFKQALGDVLDSTQYGTPDWRVANEAYQAVKKTIVLQAPEYGKAMRNYEQGTKLLKEIEGELSLGKNKNAATALRKLQAIIRDDVSSAYGRRAELAGELTKAGAEGLEETLAGQAMSSVLPRGLRGSVVGGGTTAGIGVAGGLNPASLAAAGIVGAASSPRLVGEIAHAGGRVAGPVVRGARSLPPVPTEAFPAAYQAGRGADVATGEHASADNGEEIQRAERILSEYPDAQEYVDGTWVVYRDGEWKRIMKDGLASPADVASPIPTGDIVEGRRIIEEAQARP